MDQKQQLSSARVINRSVKRQCIDGTNIAVCIIWYLAGLVMTFLALRIMLMLFAAQQGNMFVDFVYKVSGFYAYPFQGFFGDPMYGQVYFDSSSAVAIVAYALLTLGVCKIISLLTRRKEA